MIVLLTKSDFGSFLYLQTVTPNFPKPKPDCIFLLPNLLVSLTVGGRWGQYFCKGGWEGRGVGMAWV